jgi:hypothetical protein
MGLSCVRTYSYRAYQLCWHLTGQESDHVLHNSYHKPKEFWVVKCSFLYQAYNYLGITMLTIGRAKETEMSQKKAVNVSPTMMSNSTPQSRLIHEISY